jgi:hypothetical protein
MGRRRARPFPQTARPSCAPRGIVGHTRGVRYRRRRSTLSRAFDVLPVVGVLGGTMVVVALAINVLVAAAPIVANLNSEAATGSPAATPAGTASLLPSASSLIVRSVPPTLPLPSDAPVIIRSQIAETDPAGIWDVYLPYPSFQLGTTPWAEAMNSDMRTETQTRAAQWEQGPAANRQVAGKVNTLTGTFKTEVLSQALASFTITWVDDSSPSGIVTHVETVNFDLASGLRIPFDSVFSDVDAALAAISAESVRQLQVQLGSAYESAVAVEGTNPIRANFVNWAIAPAGIKVTFAEYQVSSAEGLLSVTVPWSLLRSVMVAAGPVAQLAGVGG